MLVTNPALTPRRPLNPTIDIDKGRVVFREDDPATSLHLLHEGYAKLSRISPTSREVIVDYVGPGEMIGNLTPNGLRTYTETATLITPGRLEQLDPYTVYTTPFLQDMAAEQAQAAAKRRSDRVMLSDLMVPARFLTYLLDAGERFGDTQPNGLTRVDTPFSHDDLAALLDARRATITHTVKQLHDDGLIVRDRNTYLFQPEALHDALLDLATN